MITVHHLEASRSQRVLWLLEELGVAYEIRRYQRTPDRRAPAELRAVHPLGKSPVLTDGDRTVAESAAIIEYLLEAHGGGRLGPPADREDRRRYTYFMHYAEGSLMPYLFFKLVARRIEAAPVAFFMRPVVRTIGRRMQREFVDPELARHVAFLEGELASSAWFAGPTFSAADIQMSYPVEGLITRAGLDASRPNLWRFIETIRARPAYQRALERGGPPHLDD